jgi:hypothetical protein
VQKLLPWFVNGTLDSHESARVQGHLAECEECRDDLAGERQLARAVASLPLNADDGWKAMQLRLAEAAPARGRLAPARLVGRRVPLGWAMAGSLAASFALALVMTGFRPGAAPQQTYHTLGSAPSAAQGHAVVLFKPDTTEQQMRVILSAQGARVVDGPTAAGAYVLHIDGADPAGAIQALRQSQQVVLAEPLANDGRP